MNEPTPLPENQQIIAELKRQNIWLQKLNEKFALLLILIILSAVFSFFGALMF